MSILETFHPITRACGLIEAPIEQVLSAALRILRRSDTWSREFQNRLETSYIPGSKAKSIRVNAKYHEGKLHGHWVKWHDNGQKAQEGEFRHGKQEGRWTSWYDNGQQEAMVEFHDSELHGPAIYWYDDGRRRIQGEYRHGKQHGHWIIWRQDGSTAAAGEYRDGELMSGNHVSITEPELKESATGDGGQDHRTTYEICMLNTNLQEGLAYLLPLSAGITTRHILVSTVTPPWTAYFNNNKGAWGDRAMVASLSGELRVRCVYAYKQEETLRKLNDREWIGDYGGYQFYVYNGTPQPERAVECLNDGGQWVFGQIGTPYPFEQTERYTARRKRDRFTGHILVQYLKALGLCPFEDDFYTVDQLHPAYGIQRIDTDPVIKARIKYFTLEEVRKHISEGIEGNYKAN